MSDSSNQNDTTSVIKNMTAAERGKLLGQAATIKGRVDSIKTQQTRRG